MPIQKNALQVNKDESDSSEGATAAASGTLDEADEIVDGKNENSILESVLLSNIPCDTDMQPLTVEENYSVAQEYSALELEFCNASLQITLENPAVVDTSQSVINFTDHFEEINSLINSIFPRREDSVWAHYNPLASKCMLGPTCGIVALSMASQVFNEIDAPQMLIEAVRQRYTRLGEMFDAFKLAKFARNCLQCEAEVISNLNCWKFDILSHICDGWPVLIPYDWDGQNPGLFSGERPHWAVLNGVAFRFGMTVDSKRGLRMISTSGGWRIKERLLYDCRHSSQDIFVFARENTRREISVWQFDTLLESNRNLWKCPENIFIPWELELTYLRDKAVLLKKRK